MTRIVWHATVRSVEERFKRVHRSGFGKDAKFDEVSLGWFVLFQEWPAAANVGAEKPEAKQGDRVKLTMEVLR